MNKFRAIQSIMMYGAEVWQIPTREINKILSTEMDVLRRSARKSKMQRIQIEHIGEIMGMKGKPDIIDIIEKRRLQWYARGENTKINSGMDTRGEKKKWTSKKKVVGRSTSSHDNKKFRTLSLEKEGEMAFGFRKTATAVIKPER
jgi:hypothetical protein